MQSKLQRSGFPILPRDAGEGDHAKHGGGGNPEFSASDRHNIDAAQKIVAAVKKAA